MYSFGKSTGMMVDLGEGLSHFVPIYDGYFIPKFIQKDIAGKDLTEFMAKMLFQKGKTFSANDQIRFVEDIKKKACYTALDFENEIKNVTPFQYSLPDGSSLTIKEERIICPEALFYPLKIERAGNNIAGLCNESIQNCDLSLRKELYKNICLSGGTSMFKGLPERFTKELKALVPESMKQELKIITKLDRQSLAWLGGSIIASVSSFELIRITQSEYKEKGVNVVYESKL